MSRWTRLRPRTGRHLHVRSPLSRLEWGTYGRHRRRLRRGLAIAGVLVLIGAGVASWFLFVKGNGGTAAPTPTPPPACDSAKFSGHLGSFAWVSKGTLQVRNFDTCAHATLVSANASAPVAFSPDGKWIAYGRGFVLPATGGRAQQSMGDLSFWRWAPTGHELVGVTKGGKAVIGEAGSKPSFSFTSRGATTAAVDPRGRYVAIAVGDRLELVQANGGAGKVLYSGPPKSTVHVQGFSPDGKWVVFWDLAKGKTSGPLDVAPISGAGYHNVFDPTPAFDDFVTWCGDTLVASGGGTELVSEGQQLLVSQAPQWQTHNLSRDFRSSWIWPSCSPSGKWIAVTVTPNHTERPPGYGERRIELISIDGTKRRHLALGAGVFEAPRWSADGRTLLVVVRRRDPKSSGNVELVEVDPRTGKVLRSSKAVATLGPSSMPLGHAGWTSASAWARG